MFKVVAQCLIDVFWGDLHHDVHISGLLLRACMLPREMHNNMQEGRQLKHLIILKEAHDLFQARDVPIVAVNEVAHMLCFLCGLGFALFGAPFCIVPCFQVSLQPQACTHAAIREEEQ